MNELKREKNGFQSGNLSTNNSRMKKYGTSVHQTRILL